MCRRPHPLLLLLPLLVAAARPTVRAQETEPPPAESQAAESQPDESEAAQTQTEETPTEETQAAEAPSGEAESTEAQQEEGTEPEQAEGGEAEAEAEALQEEETAPPAELSPEEQARREELKRKREERAAKRAAKKAREAAKQEEKRLAQEAKHAEQLDEILAKAEEALEAGRLDKARQAFEKHMELEGGDSFDGRMGLARLELVQENPAAAIEEALKAAKVAAEGADKARALSFAAQATRAARPRDESSGEPLPGTEIYRDNALRYYMQALAFDPEGASEARQALEQAFPSPEDERTERFYSRYVESSENAPRQHAKRLASTYEALLSGRIEGPLVVTGGISPPEKITGPQPPYPQDLTNEDIRRRLVIDLVVEPDGTVSAARILNGLDPRRDRPAEAVMRQWTFEPARLPGGEPVAVHYTLVTNADVQPLPPPAIEPETGGETGEESIGEELESPALESETATVEAPTGEPGNEELTAEEAATGEASGEEGDAGEPDTGETADGEATGGETASGESPAEASSPESEEPPPDEPQPEGDQNPPESRQ